MDKVTTDTRGVYARNNIKLTNHHCEGCPFRSRCTKSRIGRSINYCKELDEFHKEVRKNVTSEEGKKLMFKRDNEQKELLVILRRIWVMTDSTEEDMTMLRWRSTLFQWGIISGNTRN